MSIHLTEPTGQVRTKIVATLGPATRNPVSIRALIAAGVDVFRLNFSHGTHEEHSESLAMIRQAADDAGQMIAVLQDLGGPKLRLGVIPGDMIDCRLGDEFTLLKERTSVDDPRQLTCTYAGLVDDLKVGDVVLFADGTVAMNVMAVTNGQVTMIVTLPGKLRSKQGINLPNAELKLNALTEKDLIDLDWTAKHEIDYVGLSFVRKAADVDQLRAELTKRGSEAKIVAKIEKPQALDDLPAIVAATDAVMVARGDLGVEIDVARVPGIQKKIISMCHQARVPVITATQMLNSMETSSRPTRAEATDVFNAVLDGTDAVMLSGETAIGQYPIEAVETMSRIVQEAETFLAGRDADGHSRNVALEGHLPNDLPSADYRGRVTLITETIIGSASYACRKLNAALLVVATHSGRTALVASKSRNNTLIIALTPNAAKARSIALCWGVTPLVAPDITDVEAALAFAIDWARARSLVKKGDHIVWLRGMIPNDPTHNGMRVQMVN